VKRVLSDGEVVPCPLLSSWAATHALEWLQCSKRSNNPDVMDERELGRTWMTPSRVGSANMAMGESDNRPLSCPAESISVNRGDLPRDAKESGSTGGETRPKSSKALRKSQRGHSPRRTGKPSTWGRATAYEVPQSMTLTNVKVWESLPMSSEKTRGSMTS
jgi:hypothetical protein